MLASAVATPCWDKLIAYGHKHNHGIRVGAQQCFNYIVKVDRQGVGRSRRGRCRLENERTKESGRATRSDPIRSGPGSEVSHFSLPIDCLGGVS